MTRDEINSLVSFSSIFSPYEITSDAISFTLINGKTTVGYIIIRIIPANCIHPSLSSEKVLYIDALEIFKRHRRLGYGRILYEKIQEKYSNYNTLLFATRFSIPFWQKTLQGEVIDYFGRGQYIYKKRKN